MRLVRMAEEGTGTAVRFVFPDETTLVARFNPFEQGKALREFLESSCIDPDSGASVKLEKATCVIETHFPDNEALSLMSLSRSSCHPVLRLHLMQGRSCGRGKGACGAARTCTKRICGSCVGVTTIAVRARRLVAAGAARRPSTEPRGRGVRAFLSFLSLIV